MLQRVVQYESGPFTSNVSPHPYRSVGPPKYPDTARKVSKFQFELEKYSPCGKRLTLRALEPVLNSL